MMKSRITSTTILEPDGKVSQQYVSRMEKFNRAGLPVLEKVFYANGEILHKTLCKYNRKGGLIEKASFEADGRLINRTDCFYDEAGELIQTEVTAADESKLIKEHYFDRKEHFEKVVINSEYGEILGYEVYWFNKNNQVVSEIKSNTDYQVVYKRFATYNHQGLLLMEEFFGRNEQLQKKVTYSYNPAGTLSQLITSYQDKSYTLTEQFGYDSQHRLTSASILDERKGVHTEAMYHYGPDDRQLTIETFRQGQLLHQNMLLYDAEGNLLQEEMINKGTPYFHEIRRCDIQYW